MQLSRRSGLIVATLMFAFAPSAGCRRADDPPAAAKATSSASVRYVGHEKCAECHSEIAELHAASGHSRTFSLASNSRPAQLLCGQKLDGKDPFGTYEYVCDQEGLSAKLPSKFGDRLFPIDLAMGSGKHAVTFVSLTRDRSGKTAGVEHRMTWYASDGKFDITPAQEELLPVVDAAWFGMVMENDVLTRCVDCHTTTARIVGMSLENLYGGVHCERCHGPASAHVAAAEKGDSETARKLMFRPKSAIDEITQCGKCHRTKQEIDSERLQRYPKSLVRFQPVGLVMSKCFTESNGELRCTTCHDPHGPPSTRTLAEQVAACVKCHQQPSQARCPVSPGDDCIRCHMPAIDLVRGIEFHDHWIRVRKAEPATTEKDIADPHSVRP